MDDNQRVYDAELDVAPEFQRFDLTVNCRNTQAIHREVMKLYDGEIEPEVKGPPGRNVELVRTSDQAAAVAGVIRQLCEQEEVMPQDIVVLSSHSLEGSKVGRNAIDDFRFTKERGKLGKYVQFSSIRAFKGLESPVVILCELEDLDEMTQDHQLYVGLSRARNHCVVVAPDAPN
jgi:superfamily I DNA/RNA helicase